MDIEEYSDIVMDHFMCPRNMGVINNSNGEGTNGDPGCGDYLTIYKSRKQFNRRY